MFAALASMGITRKSIRDVFATVWSASKRSRPIAAAALVATPALIFALLLLIPLALPLLWFMSTGADADDAGAAAAATKDAGAATKDAAAAVGGRSTAARSSSAPPPADDAKKAPPVAAAAFPAAATTTTSAKEAVAAAAPLTGSAALMAKMRKSGAVTGEKRAQDPSSSSKLSSSKTAAPSAGASHDDPSSRLFFLHGGEASTQIARELATKASERGLTPRVVAMDDFKSCDLDETPAVAIFVVETVENAQPAEAAGTCLRFYNRKRKSGESTLLRGTLSYAVLGLGDTNLLLDRQTTTAKDCNQAAQTLDSALHSLGATRIAQRGEANDAVGLDEAVEPWCETLWPALGEAVARLKREGPGGGDADADADASGDATTVRFLYGSQTGNATEICKATAAEATANGFKTTCNAMNEVDVNDVLSPGNVLVYVVSSTGDGDAPDNCDSFFTKLKRVAKRAPDACGLGTQYCVLGLGDQNYSAFMAIPRSFTLAMEKAGASAFYPRGEADDTLGLYEYCEAWREKLWTPLRDAVKRAPELEANPALGAKKPKEDGPEAAKDEPSRVTASARPPAGSGRERPGEAPGPAPPSTPPPLKEADLVGVPALPACRVVVSMHATRATRPLDEDDAPCDGPHTAESPYLAPVTRSKLMTDPASDRRVLHLEFDLTAAKRAASLAYEPGDSIGVLPRNDPELVSELASRLGLSLESSFDLTWASEHASANQNQNQPPPLPNVRRPCVVGDVLSRSVDITSVPRKSLLRALAEACAESEDRLKLLYLCSRGGRDAYKREMVEEAPTLVDLLTTIAPSCAPDLATLLDALTPLQPRMYSITTAPEAHPGKPAVAFSVVSFQTPQGAARRGVATHWLDRSTTRGADASSSFRCPVFIKRSIAFRPPEDLSTPMLMIGPGTGVAPFRGFLQRRAAMIDAAKKKAARDGEAADVVAPGDAFLFFGCRAPTEDFLYRDEFEAFAADGTLTKLVTAFSRENPDQPKVYVQHKIREHAAAVAALIVSSDDARVYVCGDGGGMAKDVHAALCEVIASHGGVEGVTCAEDAGKMLAEMTKAGRYVRDIWS